MMMINQKITTAIADVEVALREIDGEIAAHKMGVPKVSSLEELGRFRKQLVAMLEELRAGSSSGRIAGLGRAVTDSWPWDVELAEVLIGAERAYVAARN